MTDIFNKIVKSIYHEFKITSGYYNASMRSLNFKEERCKKMQILYFKYLSLGYLRHGDPPVKLDTLCHLWACFGFTKECFNLSSLVKKLFSEPI